MDIRNYLAHNFLRDYHVCVPSRDNELRAAEWLAEMSVWVEALDETLETHLRDCGVPNCGDLDGATSMDIEKHRPTRWVARPDLMSTELPMPSPAS